MNRLIVRLIISVFFISPVVGIAQQAKPTKSASPEAQRLQAQNDSLRRLVDSLRNGAPTPSLAALEPSLTPSSQAAPFGLTMGMTEKSLRTILTLEPLGTQKGLFKTVRVPKSLPDFEYYALVIGPKQGLCKVSGTGQDISTSVYGTEAKAAFQKIEGLVVEKYGAPGNSFDFLRAGSIWNEPRDWMMGLLKKERTLAAFWSVEAGVKLPPPLSSIALELEPISSDKAYLRLGFEFKNFDACTAELKTNPF